MRTVFIFIIDCILVSCQKEDKIEKNIPVQSSKQVDYNKYIDSANIGYGNMYIINGDTVYVFGVS